MYMSIIREKWSFIEMPNKKKKHQPNQPPSVWKTLKKFVRRYESLLLVIAALAVENYFDRNYSLPVTVSEIDSRVGTLESDYKQLSNTLNRLLGHYEAYTGTNITSVSIQPSPDFENAISQLNKGIEATLLFDMIVGTDVITGQEYTVEDLVNRKILVPYVDHGMHVFFYGQYNENGKWDGDCLLNSYEETTKGNTLRFIRESTYDNGRSISSKQVYTHMAERGTKEVWGISNRILNGGISIGDTCLYEKNADKIMNFSIDECLPKDMVTVEQFREEVALSPYGYYYGNILDGLYNDNTGNAFYIKFFTDGSIKSIYSGNFKNGTFNDSTGNAWFLYKEKNDLYYTYRGGNFKNGGFVDADSEETIRNIDENSIADLMKKKEFDFTPMLEYFSIIWDFPETI